MKEKVLITGGAGFIGSHLCDILISKNLWGWQTGKRYVY
ncbi:MAG: NAD-dependent epimerase/dehydratase family protein [Bacteroidetes bacterium]|nr:NAD-dependent epimerase/dehydratase family protein [Bacteroidota bacterium]HET6245920.1 NAD-dependent epimerase/dehydratase family protein [Bacteroidia bacterium]